MSEHLILKLKVFVQYLLIFILTMVIINKEMESSFRTVSVDIYPIFRQIVLLNSLGFRTVSVDIYLLDAWKVTKIKQRFRTVSVDIYLWTLFSVS